MKGKDVSKQQWGREDVGIHRHKEEATKGKNKGQIWMEGKSWWPSIGWLKLILNNLFEHRAIFIT